MKSFLERYLLITQDWGVEEPGIFVGVEEAEIQLFETQRGFRLPDSYRDFLKLFGKSTRLFTHLYTQFPNVALDKSAFLKLALECDEEPPPWRDDIVVFAIDEDTVGFYFFAREDASDPVWHWTGYPRELNPENYQFSIFVFNALEVKKRRNK
jgi:SMI1-KNR4 cell-wall